LLFIGQTRQQLWAQKTDHLKGARIDTIAAFWGAAPQLPGGMKLNISLKREKWYKLAGELD